MSKHIVRISSKGGPGSGHHGHVGRPGQRGGGKASGSRFGPGSFSKGGDHKEGDTVLDGAVILYKDGSISSYAERGDYWPDGSNVTEAGVKRNIVSNLSEATGVSEEETNAFIRQWASSSNDTDMRSLAIQEDASKALGVALSEWQKGKIEKASKQNSRVGRPLLSSDKQQALITEMHKQTQADLKAKGYKPGESVRLYRGTTQGGIQDGKVAYKGNAIESWSVDKDVAREFAGAGTVLTMDVPIGNIIGTAATGFGCMGEGEFIILGSLPGQTAVSDQ